MIGNVEGLDESTDWCTCDVRSEEQWSESEYGPLRHSIQARRRAGRVSAELPKCPDRPTRCLLVVGSSVDAVHHV